MLYLDGVYSSKAVFYPVKPPTAQDIDKVTQKIAERVSSYLERAGYLVRDAISLLISNGAVESHQILLADFSE